MRRKVEQIFSLCQHDAKRPSQRWNFVQFRFYFSLFIHPDSTTLVKMLTFENPFQLEMVIQGNSRWSKEMIWGDLRPSLKPVARHSHTVNNNDDQFCHINYNWTGERVTARGTDDWVWTVRNTVNNNDDQFRHINYIWTGGRACLFLGLQRQKVHFQVRQWQGNNQEQGVFNFFLLLNRLTP